MAVNLGQTQDYYRGYENGKQESAARIAKLEADNANLKKVIEIDEYGTELIGRPALEARDKEIATLAKLLDSCLRKGQDLATEAAALREALEAIGKALEPFPELQERIPDTARALIREALKGEPK